MEEKTCGDDHEHEEGIEHPKALRPVFFHVIFHAVAQLMADSNLTVFRSFARPKLLDLLEDIVDIALGMGCIRRMFICNKWSGP